MQVWDVKNTWKNPYIFQPKIMYEKKKRNSALTLDLERMNTPEPAERKKLQILKNTKFSVSCTYSLKIKFKKKKRKFWRRWWFQWKHKEFVYARLFASEMVLSNGQRLFFSFFQFSISGQYGEATLKKKKKKEKKTSNFKQNKILFNYRYTRCAHGIKTTWKGKKI